MRIKGMADKLFEYFLAYATEWETADMEIVDADSLFQQVLGDYAYALESKGFQVEAAFLPVNSSVKINMELLQRALDNLYSNLLKYAVMEETVRISYERKDGAIVISMSNKTRIEQAKNDSTNIGLITCRRIIEFHGGHFKTTEQDQCFEVTVSIPLEG